MKKFGTGDGKVIGPDENDEQGISTHGAQRQEWTDEDSQALAEENRQADSTEE